MSYIMHSGNSATSIPRRTNKADSEDLTGITGPKQTVGAGLPAMRRAGGARSHGRCRNIGGHLVALMQDSGMRLATLAQA
jgi:hypothetical protein